jgi:hypothetical protein
LRSTLRVADELIRIDYAGHTPIVGGGSAGRRLVGPHHAATALDDDIFFAARNIGREGDFKLNG